MSEITNGWIMRILEDIAKEWSSNKTDEQVSDVVDYLNELCYKWMGGDWGLRVEDIRGTANRQKVAPVGHSIQELSDGLRRYETVRKLNCQQFHALFLKNLETGVPFDTLVDQYETGENNEG